MSILAGTNERVSLNWRHSTLSICRVRIDDLGKTVSLPPKMLVLDLRGECERAGDGLELALVIGISSVVETKPWNVDQHPVLSFSTLMTVWVPGALMKAQVNLEWTRSWRRRRTRRSRVWSVCTPFLLQDRQAPATFGALLANKFLSKAHCHPQELRYLCRSSGRAARIPGGVERSSML